MTMHISHAGRQRLKLLALIGVFIGPLIVAWSMVEWRVGIPDERVAHGQLMPALPNLQAWPMQASSLSLGPFDWVLAYDCAMDCPAIADRWWRLHRALGREAPRLTRLRFGGQTGALPGEIVAQWRARPGWSHEGSLWLIDPEGQVVLSYRPYHEAEEVLEDLRHLLKMNPQPALAIRE
ncbi:hypothetical protein DFO67_104384 [Modicisalibacter xianhensis]|uniref:Cytochrome oxidase Cu insertion factor, SCO1/SenC/PrrC family n=1 Tax=Modicisalibacter xianhensis TaxID=442341 RepID=A0A4R8FW89_9GAMM|nr:hypothetical protein [Halomonas xianhensis]TDX31118.1 hypothetical protein DFO67_104384 [Halomonas xianhensis]